MKINDHIRNGFGLFRNFGWKKNLLAIAAGFLCCEIVDLLMGLVSNVQVLSQANPTIAIVPLIGYSLGIWGSIGVLLQNMLSVLLIFKEYGGEDLLLSGSYYVLITLAIVVYSALPAMLWYALPLKGEKRSPYPRLDTSAHVIKYYVITIVTLAVLLIVDLLVAGPEVWGIGLDIASVFTQYLDIVLIVGMPLIILSSVIRNRTITINERMVLAFLMVGVIASALGVFLVYRTATYLDPDLFNDYEYLYNQDMIDWTEENYEAIERYTTFWNWFYIMIAFMLNILMAVEIVFMRSIEKKVTRPILHLSTVLEKYTDQEGGFDPATLEAECRPYRYGYGEVSDLTRTCVEMADEIDSYTKNLQTVTAEKERIGAELDIASGIQRDMLPGIFPPFPDRKEIDLYASMSPAKEVGGDFYDFYFIDKDHMALTIADVSDKGVPAALFMVISKTLLKNQAQTGGTPKEILTYVNHQLCQNNTSLMFCTVWLGILELSTGKLTASNAGHEYPVIRSREGRFELMKDRHDPPIGVIDGLRYREYEMNLSPGDCLFVYTDGVTEATNAALEQFGEERLTETLNQEENIYPEVLIGDIHRSIQEFADGASQFDDITMLCVKYMGKNEEPDHIKRVHLTVPARVDRLDEVMEFTETQLRNAGCSDDDLFAISLAVEEIYVNIANYAYDGGSGDANIDFSFDENDHMVEIIFSDGGIPFDPTSRPSPNTKAAPGDRQIGGLGIYIVKQTMDDVIYEYLGGKNTLTIKKYI